MSRLAHSLRGNSLTARAVRGSTWTILGYGGGQVLRLASNLILTRLLFPEAFGAMALVSMFLMGLAMFSDIGVGPAIMRSPRGDDRDFLNTAWTIQVVRGFGLWLVAAALAWPMAWLYQTPDLAGWLLVGSLSLLIMGFNPTRMETANRHLALGRVTLIDLSSQVVGLVIAIVLALALRSVWALVISGVLSSLVHMALNSALLPGERNRFNWDRTAAHELVHFGKWIFLSTVAGFLYSQGDRAILGKYLSLDMLGIYNIGYFLASFPMLLGGALVRKIMIPLYRERPPGASAENFAKFRRLRMPLTAALVALLIGLALFGVALVRLLYDPRYDAAGAVVVLIACAMIVPVITVTYDQAALASGDGRAFFTLAGLKAGLLIAGLLAGVELAGLFGALVGQGLAMLAIYPATIWLARRQGAWDPLHDFGFAGIGALGIILAIWLNLEPITALIR